MLGIPVEMGLSSYSCMGTNAWKTVLSSLAKHNLMVVIL